MERKWKRKQREEVPASVRPDGEATQEEKRRERRPPLLALTFVRKATNVDSSTSIEELCNRIYGGVFMNSNKLKFRVNQDLEKNCFLLLAKDLSITWIDDRQYWDWIDQKEKCFSGEVDIPAAKLLKVCWLNIWGKFKTIMLSPKTTYEVSFKVKISGNSGGWHAPVNLNLTLPDGTTQGRIENLEEKQKGEWIDILVGTFMTNPKNVGEISFSFSETGGHWKSGLLVKGVVLRPKD
ncbi:uncharacterized protein PHLOEM PROTEIN 2-LIKE A4-like [Syzygium oleosum]|uniref:uncharacterized protein PHLOEM PROTEIN 2-LIKE A4-like n=1 Tax=Syzygium oleosum TaxID=219896 RepID=UPI0024BAF16A|nr:uncharacterized protein PHLOEM PROTEIN 2-LIKE A4-like [Syzygium oleosum]